MKACLTILFCLLFASVSNATKKKSVWKGYTAVATDGSMGGVTMGIKGANTQCDAAYPGSHACRYKEIVSLGNSYPHTSNAWVIDGSYSQYTSFAASQVTSEGGANDNSNGGTFPMCGGWKLNDASHMGPYANTSGSFGLDTCDLTHVLPCCK